MKIMNTFWERSCMSKNVTETYAWNEYVFERLIIAKEKGTFIAINENHFGKVLDVNKKIQNEESYIEVVFKRDK